MLTRSVTGAVAAAGVLIALYTTGAQAAVVEMVLKPCEPGQPQQDAGAKLNVVNGNVTFTTQQGQTLDLTTQDLLAVDCNGNATKSTQNGTILSFGATGSIGGGGGGGTIGSLGPQGASNAGGGAAAPGNTNNTPSPLTSPPGAGGSTGPNSPL